MHAERSAHRTQKENRGVFVHQVVGEHLPCSKKKLQPPWRESARETVALMLLEQLPTQMTKLPRSLFTAQLHSHVVEEGRAPSEGEQQELQGRVSTARTAENKRGVCVLNLHGKFATRK